ncbi:MAG: DUF4114 domain-containing protein, partial [Thermoguttaceae bacterium]
DDTNESLQSGNPDNILYRRPLAFFSLAEANPDHGFDHVFSFRQTDGSLTFAWEDLLFGGDRDFDDVVFTIDLGSASPVGEPTAMALSGPFVPEDLGSVDFAALPSQRPADGDLWYRLVPKSDGILTVEALGDQAQGSIGLELYADSHEGTPVAVSSAVAGGRRIDWAGDSSRQYFVRLSGDSSDVSLRLVALVAHDGTTLTVRGTDADDSFDFDPATSKAIVINGIRYHFAGDEVNSITFDGGGGNDTVTLTDTAGNESLTAEPGHATFVNLAGQFHLEASGFEVLNAYGRRGGNDTATLHGSVLSDKFKAEADAGYAKMYGNGLYHRVKFFDWVDAFSEGGNDLARLFGSTGTDEFFGQRDASTLRSNRMEVTVRQFSRVIAAAGSGGLDIAQFGASDAKDEFQAKPHKADLFDQTTNGKLYRITAQRFDQYYSQATPGGGDKAKLWDTTGDDRLEVGQNWAKFSHDGPDNDLLYHVLAYDMVKANGLQGGTNTQRVQENCDMLLFLEGDWQ